MQEHYTRQKKPYTSAWMHMHNANSWENQRSGDVGTCKQDKSMTSSCLSVSPSLSITLLLCLSLLFPCPFPSFFHWCIFYSFLFPSFLQSPTWPGGGGHGEWRVMQIYLIRWKKMRKIEIFLLGDIFVYHCLPFFSYHNTACFQPDQLSAAYL